MAELLHLNVSSRMYWAFRDVGRLGLREYYEDNLVLVLEAVKKLVGHLEGTIVITADHGTMLGEKNLYNHWPNSKERILREVPWLIIENTHSESMKSGHKAEQSEEGSEITKEEVEEKGEKEKEKGRSGLGLGRKEEKRKKKRKGRKETKKKKKKRN